MRVLCGSCGEKAQITKTHRLSVNACDLYCLCGCGHRFVWKAGYSHSLGGSPKDKVDLIGILFKALGDEEKRDLIRSLSGVCA